ncbi:MAG: STAS domain-containing protein [Solirubrobacteraceae bacterium]|jgi:anti-anti-sigma factor
MFVCSWTDGSPDAWWVHVAGALDAVAVCQLERALDEARLRARLVVLDLRALSSIASSGVHAVIGASDRARRAGGRLVLVRGAPNIERMFRLSGRTSRLEIGDLTKASCPSKIGEFSPAADGVPAATTTGKKRVTSKTCGKPAVALQSVEDGVEKRPGEGVRFPNQGDSSAVP